MFFKFNYICCVLHTFLFQPLSKLKALISLWRATTSEAQTYGKNEFLKQILRPGLLLPSIEPDFINFHENVSLNIDLWLHPIIAGFFV